MHTHRYTFFASIFTLLLVVSSATYAQNGATANGNSIIPHGDANSTAIGAGSSEDWSSLDMESSQFMQNHPRIAKAMKFLNNDSYRAGIEANLNISSADKQAIEAAVTDAKSNVETLKGLRPQYKAARASHDSLTLYQLEKSSRPNFDQLVTDRRTIIDIIAKYKFATPTTPATTGSLFNPVYPNPVHLGGPFTFSYDMKASGPFRIVVTDASGNIVKEIDSDTEAPGNNSMSQFGSIFPAVGTYYITVESNGAKSTQKVEVVQ